uniref:Uncharacterized protein n=1 Tax=Tanacetum cinerariifolium TaxID=118510 RepID=A0A6L2JGF1_TANCI|nr:hypothetical protein [Tanacetum cinerariifolium]
MEKDDKAAGEVMMKTDDDDDNTKDDDEEREICRMGVMDNIDLYTQILEVMASLELCTVIPRASKNLKKKFFKFVIQRDKGKEEMFRVYVEKKGEIQAELEAFAKPTKIFSCEKKVIRSITISVCVKGDDLSHPHVHQALCPTSRATYHMDVRVCSALHQTRYTLFYRLKSRSKTDIDKNITYNVMSMSKAGHYKVGRPRGRRKSPCSRFVGRGRPLGLLGRLLDLGMDSRSSDAACLGSVTNGVSVDAFKSDSSLSWIFISTRLNFEL